MSSKSQTPGDGTDPILDDIHDAVNPIADTIESGDDHALFVLGVKYDEKNGDDYEVSTYLSVVGFFGILAEGLYAELMDQIERGQNGLFEVLRAVVHDIEEDLGLEDGEHLKDDDEPPTHLH